MIPYARIAEIAAARGNSPAIVMAGKSITWSEFQIETGRYINALRQISHAQKLDRLCFISPNREELIYLLAASASLKLTAFGLDYTQNTDSLRSLMRTAGADAVVVSSRALVDLGFEPQALTEGRPSIDLDGILSTSLNVQHTPPLGANEDVPLRDRPFCAIGFTSGTSGLPKVVIRDKSFDARRFAYFTARYGFSSGDRHMITIPLYHAAGNGWARLFLNLGATIVLPPANDWSVAARMLVSEGITTSAMTPPIIMTVCRELEASRRMPQPGILRFVLVGGKNFSAGDKAYCSNIIRSAIHEYYGTTETGVNTIAEPDDILMRPDTVGKAYDGNELLIVDKKGQPQPPGTRGRVAISSYMNMARYESRKADTIEHNGKVFILTNETGSIDAEGYLRLSNRNADAGAADLYRLEDEIKRLPCVGDAAIVPDGKAIGQGVSCGFVVKENAAGTPVAVANRIRRIMQSAQIRKSQVGAVDAIPYSPSGKVNVPALRDLLNASMAPEGRGFESKLLIGVALLAGTAAAWGGMFHIAKSAITTLDAFHVTLVRYGLAALIFLALLIVSEGARSLIVPRRDALKLWGLGSLGFAGFSILAFWGLEFTKPEHGAIIMALMPFLTVIVTTFWKGTKVSSFTAGCIVVALAGVLLVVTNGDVAALGGGALVPNLVIMLGAFCWVIYTVGARSFPEYSVLRYTGVSCAFGAVSIVLVTAVATAVGYISTPSLADMASVRGELTYLVLIAGVAAVFSWNTGIKILGPVNGVLFINLVPVAALGFGWMNGHQFSTLEISGSVITIIALVANNMHDRGWMDISGSRQQFTVRGAASST